VIDGVGDGVDDGVKVGVAVGVGVKVGGKVGVNDAVKVKLAVGVGTTVGNSTTGVGGRGVANWTPTNTITPIPRIVKIAVIRLKIHAPRTAIRS
jgi:hypothetical protein